MAKSSPNASATPGPSSNKRRKLEDEDSHNFSKKQRTRVSFSCGECHRRKQKCDRQVPCSHCVARKVPELCKAYTPGKSDQDVNLRLARLEHIIEIALPQFCTPGTPNSSFDNGAPGDRNRSPSMQEDDHSQPEDQDANNGIFQSGKWYGNSASGSVAPASVLEQLQNAVSPSANQDDQSRHHLQMRDIPPSSSGNNIGSLAVDPNLDNVPQDLEPSAADNLKSLVQECGVSPHKISELLQELPPLRYSDVLIDYYFTSINWTRYPISERDFRASYGSICAHGAHGIGATNPNDVRFLPLLFVVLAIAVRLAPEDIGGESSHRRVTSLRYYWSSRRSLLIAVAIQPDSLDLVITRLLSARFLTFDRRITETWSQLGAAIRTAQALGLHRDGSTMNMDPAQIEYRRRIWSYLYHADRSYALVLGRPNAIQDEYTSTHPPLNIDEEPTTSLIRNPPSLATPTPMTFVILRHQLAAIIGRMVHHFQQVRKSHYSEVLNLDDELLKFVAMIPPHFSLEPDTSLDETLKYIPVHRFLLVTEILFVRISLHRPYLLRRLGSDRYLRSRAACFESAMKDFEVRKAFRDTVPERTRESLGNAYREFQTALISGIYLVLEPRGRDAGTMHTILDGFMKDHEGMREMDQTTRRELKTIEFLKNKASDVEKVGGDFPRRPSTSSSMAVDSGNPMEHPAQLLLGLQKSPPATSFPVLSRDARSPSSSRISPSIPHVNTSQVAHMPFHRLQQDGYAPSPSGSGSPGVDDESTAQSMLDQWYDSVSNGPPIDGSAGVMGWGGTDFGAWVGTTQSLPVNDPRHMNGIDGADWSYWENLVNHIHKP